jgi:hypothetical protein
MGCRVAVRTRWTGCFPDRAVLRFSGRRRRRYDKMRRFPLGLRVFGDAIFGSIGTRQRSRAPGMPVYLGAHIMRLEPFNGFRRRSGDARRTPEDAGGAQPKCREFPDSTAVATAITSSTGGFAL